SAWRFETIVPCGGIRSRSQSAPSLRSLVDPVRQRATATMRVGARAEELRRMVARRGQDYPGQAALLEPLVVERARAGDPREPPAPATPGTEGSLLAGSRVQEPAAAAAVVD